MYVISRKVKVVIERNLAAVCAGRFTEREIKELMVDLRELGRASPKIGIDEPAHARICTEFAEVCDFVAHTNRGRGLIETQIRNRADYLAQSVGQEPAPDFHIGSVNDPTWHANSIAVGLLGMAYLYLSTADISFSPDRITAAYRRINEISLCIASLLQDSVITLKNNAGTAILHLLVHGGFYRVQCHIHGSQFHKEIELTAGASRKVVLVFLCY